MYRKFAAGVLAAITLSTTAFAQERNELGLLLGGTVTPDQVTTGASGENIEFGVGHTFQATYARHLLEGGGLRLSLEVPFLAAPSIKVSSINQAVPQEYASLFLTPGLRVSFVPDGVLSPWLSVGGGYALFEHANELLSGDPNDPANRHRHSGAAQVGGGVDIHTPLRLLFPVTLRLEVRDLYSGSPNYNVDTNKGNQHNVVFSGGFAIHF